MLKNLLIFLATVLSFCATAQHSVMNFSDDFINMNHQSILLIPFEPYMYQSDINKELHEENGLNGDEIRNRFIAAVDKCFMYTFNNKCDISSFYYLEENEREKDLSFVFNNRKLEYVSLNEQELGKLESFKKLFKKPKTDQAKNGRIENGQIVTEVNNKPKYMRAVANDILIDSLNSKFNTDYFLFINELDIKNQYGSVYEMSRLNYNRKINLHYTLYHSNGKVVSTGISSTTFPATENNIDNIIKNHFPALAQNIYKDLFHESAN